MQKMTWNILYKKTVSLLNEFYGGVSKNLYLKMILNILYMEMASLLNGFLGGF